MLIETRAKGGNLLLNVGPKPDGELAIEQEDRLREVALWMFVNSECIYSVRPWIIANEGEIWFTKKKDESTLYAILKTKEPWGFGAWKEIVLKSVVATPQTQVSVLSQNEKVLEYQPNVVPESTFEQRADGLHVRALNALRLYTSYRWPNAVVIKITNVKPALVPPRIQTGRARWDAAAQTATLSANLPGLGDAPSVEAGFEYREVVWLERGVWKAVPLQRVQSAGVFSTAVKGWKPGQQFEIRAVGRHPRITPYGAGVNFRVP